MAKLCQLSRRRGDGGDDATGPSRSLDLGDCSDGDVYVEISSMVTPPLSQSFSQSSTTTGLNPTTTSQQQQQQQQHLRQHLHQQNEDSKMNSLGRSLARRVTQHAAPQSMANKQQQHQSRPGRLSLGSARNLTGVAHSKPSNTLWADTPGDVVRKMADSVRDYVERSAALTNCARIHLCDGTEGERQHLIHEMEATGVLTKLNEQHYDNCWLARTDPRDVARVESRTYICTRNKHDVVPRAREHAQQGALGNWMHVDQLDAQLGKLLPNCMSGRTMYVIPFSMGPIGSPLSKIGIQLTDSAYVVVSMHIMTRVSTKVLDLINIQGEQQQDYVKCLHSVGCPLPSQRPIVNNWPCNPEQTIISHIPERKQIVSYGSGYGGNSLLGKKCFALRIGSMLGRQEGWLAEHMLILGITNPQGQKKYIAAAFPSACGKTNLAMMTPALEGYKVECVGDDIAWMRFDAQGVLRAINPEAGFFGVAPGTNTRSNPNAMATIKRNTIFTNVAITQNGMPYWEGLERDFKDKPDTLPMTDWQGRQWTPSTSATPAAHPNSRFCAPADQCPIIDDQWQSSEGVPISAIVFGGRRPEGVPLVYESFDWQHGVFVGASMRSESTAAAEHKAKTLMHDPFAMRPFFGYNFGHYLDHWLSFGTNNINKNKQSPKLRLPKIFHVNWFRRSNDGQGDFLWPGFGENARVLDWICRRVDGEQCAQRTPIGLVPRQDSINVEGLPPGQQVAMRELLSVPRDFWLKEQQIVDDYLTTNVGSDLPNALAVESQKLRQRLEAASAEDDSALDDDDNISE